MTRAGRVPLAGRVPPTRATGAEALDALFWRAEILQALFWMRGEGLASAVAPAALAQFLAGPPESVASQVRRLAREGYLERAGPDGDGYRLTALGVAEGGRSFHDEFADLTRPAHGDCGPSCWCRDPDHVGEPCPNEPRQPAEPVPATPEPPGPAPDPEGRRGA